MYSGKYTNKKCTSDLIMKQKVKKTALLRTVITM